MKIESIIEGAIRKDSRFSKVRGKMSYKNGH
jgi:hypothetical protein